MEYVEKLLGFTFYGATGILALLSLLPSSHKVTRSPLPCTPMTVDYVAAGILEQGQVGCRDGSALTLKAEDLSLNS